MIKIAINGFGRIGRKIVRSYIKDPILREKIQIVAINDLSPIKTSTHLLKYDSVHGKLKEKMDSNSQDDISVITQDDTLLTMKYISERSPKNLPWKELDVDIVLECTGIFTDGDLAKQHIEAGAKKVILSAPGKNIDKTVVFGVNEKELTSEDVIISNASCTTNCLAPIINVLNKKYDILSGVMTTIHAYTGDQNVVDAPHSDLFRSRAAGLSMIPTKTGAAEAIGLVIPELNGKLKGMAVRVPTPNVSMVDLSCVLRSTSGVDEGSIHQDMFDASNNDLLNILAYNKDSCVSVDYNGEEYSSIYDSTQTIVSQIEDNLYQVKICAWYDNESGFSKRMLDLSVYIANLK